MGIVSVLIAIGAYTFIEPILRLFGATDAVLPYAKDYLSIIFMGSFFFGVTVCANCTVRLIHGNSLK